MSRGRYLWDGVIIDKRGTFVRHGGNVLFVSAASQPPPKILAVVHRTSSITGEDRENALEVYKNALKSKGSTFFYETCVFALYVIKLSAHLHLPQLGLQTPQHYRAFL